MVKQTNESASQSHADESAVIDQHSLDRQVSAAPAPAPPDPDDLQSLWAPLSMSMTVIRTVNMTVATRPPKDKFIQVYPFGLLESGSPCEYHNCRPVNVFEYKFPGEFEPRLYFVRPGTEVATLLADKGKVSPAILALGQVRNGGLFVWAIKLPTGRNGVADQWAHSRMEIAKHAESKWLKPCKSKSGNGYDFEEPVAVYDDPDWSKIDFDQAIKAACKDRIIDSVEHEAVKEALGL